MYPALVQRDFPLAAVNCGLERAKDLRGNEDNDEWRAYHRPLYLPSVFLPPKSYSKKTVAMVTGTKKGRVRISRFKREECAKEAERGRQRYGQRCRAISEKKKEQGCSCREGGFQEADAGHWQVIST